MTGQIITFESHGDESGSLIALEAQKNIPFDIKRVYYVFETTEGAIRGNHAHKHLMQVAVAVKGSCRFVVDDGKERKDIWLDDPHKGLLLTHNIWREMHDFSEDCVLMVLANRHYDISDYIHDYNEFLECYKK